MKKIFCCLLICISAAAGAQTNPVLKKEKPGFYSVNQLGLLEGEKGSAFLMQTVNGMEYNGWGAGVGVGIDKYAERSIPVFLQVQRRLFKSGSPLYFYADAGKNFLWVRKPDASLLPLPEYEHGLYFDAGLQYNWRLKGDQGLVLSLGYTEKRNSVEYTTPMMCITTPCPEQKSIWMYTYRRIALKAGWLFR